ncbi:AsmA family protein [Rhizobium sp. XQZ8]|uniref:AsmA family protein n=1 Tax=Rhizobium populisoli TaxID=2859785 RepID=UPI001CA5B13B|nr:AsmA-like C-terminal region-containing protein [Rhizobium populisoli]MBW6420783.1 AsmA family protein [Rhizobium populisoli]
MRKNFGRPLGRRSKRALIIAGVVLCILVLFQALAPFLISSTLVRENMERAVARWTGHEVTIAGAPDIRFWPKPRVTLRDITVRKKQDGKDVLLGQVASLSASFDVFRALIGKPEFQDFRLTDPEIHVIREADGRLDWANDGILSRAVREVKPDGSGQVLASDADARMGAVEIVNGTVAVFDVASRQTLQIRSVQGSFDWPWLSHGIAIKAAGQVNGRRLSLDASSTQPLLLLSGRSGQATGTLRSELFQGRFDGSIDFTTQPYLSGEAELEIPDLVAMRAWSGLDFPGAERLKKLSFEARLVTNDNALRFDDLSLALNDAKASGILDLVTIPGRAPRLTGTLAFDQLDFSGVLAAVAPRALGSASPGAGLRTLLDLDMRLSAQQAMLGPFQLSEAAISVMSTADQSRIDIVDSDFESGRLTGRIATIKGSSAEGGVGLRLDIHDADLGSIVKQLALPGPLPNGRGSLELVLDIDRPMTREAWQNAAGDIRLKAGRGVLQGVDISGIRKLAAQKPYFALSEAGKGQFPFDSMTIAASLSNGSADIREGQIVGSEGALSLSGVIPYASNSLALSAAFRPAGEEAAAFATFIGGSWPDPVLWPISQAPAKPTP